MKERKNMSQITYFEPNEKEIIRLIGKDKYEKILNILNNLLPEVVPQEQEKKKIEKKVNFILNRLEKSFSKLNIKATLILGGSFAKDTWLPNQSDIDVFVAFDKNHWEQDLSLLLKKALETMSKTEKTTKIIYEVIHGSRDYYKLYFDSLEIELVPVRKVSSPKDAINTTDLSLLHLEWLENKKKLMPWITTHIRLAKKFMKSSHCYGAETYIKGFSGHLVDVLVVHYSSFLKLIIAASRWPENKEVVIDPEHLLKDPLKELDESKIQSPLVVVDPTNKDRNAAAALSWEKYRKFIVHCKDFLLAPSKEYFIERPITSDTFIENYKDKAKVFIIMKVKPLLKKEDVAGAKMYKAYEFISKKLERFGLIAKEFYWKPIKIKNNSINEQNLSQEGLFLFAIQNTLPSELIIEGPHIKRTTHVKRFKEKHRNIFVKDNILFAIEKPSWKNFKEYIDSHSQIIKQWVQDFTIEEVYT